MKKFMSNKDIENDKKLDKEDAEVVGTEIAIIDDRSIRIKYMRSVEQRSCLTSNWRRYMGIQQKPLISR